MSLSLGVEVLERAEAKPYGQLFEECSHGLAQQSLQWSDVIASISPDKPYFLVVCKNNEQRIIGGLPLFHFEGELGGILTSGPYPGSLGGVLCRKDFDDTSRKRVYGALVEGAIYLAEKLRCVSLSIITNPFLGDAELYSGPTPPSYVLNNFCQVIDMCSLFNDSGTYNTGKSKYNRHIRKNLSKAAQAGVTVQWGEDNNFDAWYEIHRKRHKEIGAIPLPRQLLKGILSIMKPAGMGGFAVTEINERIVGGCLYIWNKDVVDAFMLSGDSDYLRFGINHAVTDFVIRHFRGLGIRWFNWQSSRRDSGVYIFKERWGSWDRKYQFLTWTFSGFEKVIAAGVDVISKAYQWHYMAPFEAIKKGLANGTFEKTV